MHIEVSNFVCVWPSRCVHQQTRRQPRLTFLTHSPCSPASRHRKASAAAAPVWHPWPPLPLHPRSAGAWLHLWPVSRDYGLRALRAHRPTLPQAGRLPSTSKQLPNRRPVWPWRLRDEEQDCTTPFPALTGAVEQWRSEAKGGGTIIGRRGVGVGQGHSLCSLTFKKVWRKERYKQESTKQHGQLREGWSREQPMQR